MRHLIDREYIIDAPLIYRDDMWMDGLNEEGSDFVEAQFDVSCVRHCAGGSGRCCGERMPVNKDNDS